MGQKFRDISLFKKKETIKTLTTKGEAARSWEIIKIHDIFILVANWHDQILRKTLIAY